MENTLVMILADCYLSVLVGSGHTRAVCVDMPEAPTAHGMAGIEPFLVHCRHLEPHHLSGLSIGGVVDWP
jgi:hypothetical protein